MLDSKAAQSIQQPDIRPYADIIQKFVLHVKRFFAGLAQISSFLVFKSYEGSMVRKVDRVKPPHHFRECSVWRIQAPCSMRLPNSLDNPRFITYFNPCTIRFRTLWFSTTLHKRKEVLCRS